MGVITECPPCGEIRDERMPPGVSPKRPWSIRWGVWMQVSGTTDGGEFIRGGYYGGGDEGLLISCPVCGFEILTPSLFGEPEEP